MIHKAGIEKSICPLCRTPSEAFFEHYHLCPTCDLRFLNPSQRLAWAEESARYELHENRSSDENYQNFLKPAVDLVSLRCPQGARGIDYGCGADSAASLMLRQRGYAVDNYDPKYFPDKSILARSYDFVIATEVIEHLHNPADEFNVMREMLHSGGVLAVMTHIYSENIDFKNWYYRRDPTHVAFYSAKTFRWISGQFNFQSVEILSDRTAYFEVGI